MASRDLREWLKKVEEVGELKKIDGAHWDEEIGALMFLARNKQTDYPAVLFDNIKDYPKGYRVVTAMFSSRKRMSLTAYCQQGGSDLELVDMLRRKMRDNEPIPPKVVQGGPVLENIQNGKDIDLFKFPVPKWYPHDRGRYIGTGHAIVTKDPEEGWINVGTYRTMICDKSTVVTMIEPGQHGRLHREKYFKKGKPMPAVIIPGGDPILHMIGSLDVAYGLSEYDYAGGLAGEPMEVIEGPATGLPIPANAEIAVEVEYLPDDLRDEGPIREFTATYSGGHFSLPAGKVLTVMHRNDPIICGRVTRGRTLESEGVNAWMIAKSASIWNQMEKAGVPGVRGVWCHPMGMCMWVVVSIKKMYRGHAKQVGLMATSVPAGNYYGRYVIVVDDDINPSSDYDVIWALSMRSDPVSSIDIIRNARAGMLDPAIRGAGRGLTSEAIIDATIPFDWSPEEKMRVQRAGTDSALAEKLKKRYGKALYE